MKKKDKSLNIKRKGWKWKIIFDSFDIFFQIVIELKYFPTSTFIEQIYEFNLMTLLFHRPFFLSHLLSLSKKKHFRKHLLDFPSFFYIHKKRKFVEYFVKEYLLSLNLCESPYRLLISVGIETLKVIWREFLFLS